MTHPLGYHVDPSPVIAALTEKYGDQLEKMSTADKFVSIAIFAQTLHGYEICPGLPIRITWHLSSEPSASLRQSLTALDGSSRKTLLSLMEALVAQLRHLEREPDFS